MNKKKDTYHHGNLKHDLINAGLKIINEEGIERLSLRKAAAMCGVSHAAPQSHFKDKEEFVDAIKKQVAEEFTEAMQKALDENLERKHLIDDFGIAYIRFFENNPDYLIFIINQKDIDIRISKDKVYDSTYAPFQIFQKNSSEVLLAAGIPQTEISRIIIRLWAIAYGLSAITVMKGFHYEGDWMDMVNSIINGGTI